MVDVRSKDGVRLHTEVFGPEDGYPIVLAHGITCAHPRLGQSDRRSGPRLPRHRLRPPRPRPQRRAARRGGYSLDYLAADLDAVLEATLAPGERAVIAGHSMGGIAISSWSERYPAPGRPARRRRRADQHHHRGPAAQHQLLPVPPTFADARVRAAGAVLKTFGAAPLVRAADSPAGGSSSTIAVGRDADPGVVDFVFDLFTGLRRPGAAGGLGCSSTSRAAAHRSEEPDRARRWSSAARKDRLLPMVRRAASPPPRRIWLAFVELSGGHCAILEQPDEVNAASAVAGRVGRAGAATLRQLPVDLAGCPNPGAHRAVEEPGPPVGGLRPRPEDAVDGRAQPPAVRRPRARAAPPPSARRARIPLRPSSDRRSRSGRGAPSPNSAAKPASATSRRCSAGSGSNVRASVKPSRMPGPSSPGLTSKVMNTGPSSDSASPE